MAEILDWINLLRIRQWYKNLLVFLAIFFVGHLFYWDELILTVVGFFALSFVSSANYIVNDLVDLKKDKLHPEKRFRPLAAAKIGKVSATILAGVLFVVGILLSLYLGLNFFYLVVVMIVLTQVYSFFLKNIIFADILVIAVLFVLRAISGGLIIDVKISPWLILCPFFLSLFLSVGKRHSDLLLLKGKASITRKVLKDYNKELTRSLMLISTTLLIISYALYSFLSDHANLIYTLPFALFVVFRYFHLVNKGSEIARHPEKIIRDRQMIIGVLLWVLVTAAIIYI